MVRSKPSTTARAVTAERAVATDLGLPGPTYVAADVRHEGISTVLRQAGLDSERPVLFVVEGVTMYLQEDVVCRLLRELWDATATGGRLAIDFYPPRAAGTAEDRKHRRLQDLTRVGGRETFRLCVEPEEAVRLVESCQWRVTERGTRRQAVRDLVPHQPEVPVDAVSEHKAQVAAART